MTVPSAATLHPDAVVHDDALDEAARLEVEADHVLAVAVVAARSGEFGSAGRALQRFDELLARARALLLRSSV